MPDFDLVKDGARQMTICNACRYCEGYCAVFPAMEQRRIFTKADLTYLANLCFDCRDCYYACQYAPPHEFGVNIPKLMSELRADTYREFTWPAILSGLFNRNALAVSVITVASIVIILALVLVFQGADVLFATHLGEGTFYRVVPFVAMTVPPSLIALYGFAIFVVGALRFWRETQGPIAALVDPGRAVARDQRRFRPRLHERRRRRLQLSRRELFTIADVVSPSNFLRISTRLGGYEHRRFLRSLSRLAGAVSLFQRAGGSRHRRRHRLIDRHRPDCFI